MYNWHVKRYCKANGIELTKDNYALLFYALVEKEPFEFEDRTWRYLIPTKYCIENWLRDYGLTDEEANYKYIIRLLAGQDYFCSGENEHWRMKILRNGDDVTTCCHSKDDGMWKHEWTKKVKLNGGKAITENGERLRYCLQRTSKDGLLFDKIKRYWDDEYSQWYSLGIRSECTV
jgi:hypothetical protein